MKDSYRTTDASEDGTEVDPGQDVRGKDVYPSMSMSIKRTGDRRRGLVGVALSECDIWRPRDCVLADWEWLSLGEGRTSLRLMVLMVLVSPLTSVRLFRDALEFTRDNSDLFDIQSPLHTPSCATYVLCSTSIRDLAA